MASLLMDKKSRLHLGPCLVNVTVLDLFNASSMNGESGVLPKLGCPDHSVIDYQALITTSKCHQIGVMDI